MLSIFLQFLMAFLALASSWLILLIPAAAAYYFQFFCFYVFLFMVVNIISRHRQRPLPQKNPPSSLNFNFEIALVGGAIFLLIGSTGGLDSWLLPLFFIYFFFATFVNHLGVTFVMTFLQLAFLYCFTINFGQAHSGAILSIAIFIPIAIFAHNYYARWVKDNLELQQEKEKVAYYNMYAEKKQNELLTAQVQAKQNVTSLTAFLNHLIPQIDELQKASRFSQNQLVISEQLTKIGLSLRKILKENPPSPPEKTIT